jgi:hypothetical protein
MKARVPQSCCNPRFSDHRINIPTKWQWKLPKPMKNGQVACIDVNLDNNLTVYLDLQPLSFLQALIMMLRDRV